MVGQLIVLSGVRSLGIPGAARIDMDDGDRIAAAVPSLRHAISARHASVAVNGDIALVDRTDGRPLKYQLSGGAITKLASDSIFNGHPTLQWSYTSNTGLLFQAKMTGSYTVLAAVSLGEVFFAGTPTSTINGTLFGTADPVLGTVADAWGLNVRMRRATSGSNGLIVNPAFPNGGGPTIQHTYLAANNCFLIAVTVDEKTGAAVSYMNSGSKPMVTTKFTEPIGITDDMFWCLGNAGLSGSQTAAFRLGDFYVFNEALDATEYGRDVLDSLMTAMRAKYGIT